MFCGYRGISLITCFSLMFFGVDAVSDELPQPGNLSLSWSPDYSSVCARWSEPAGLETDCKVSYEIHFYSKKCPPSAEEPRKWRVEKLTHTWKTEEDEMCVSITTNPKWNCGNKTSSKSLLQGLSRPPGLVKNFTCLYYSHMKMNCTWISNTTDLQLFYRPHSESSLKPCVSYIGKGHMRTGCHLYGKEFVNDTFVFLVNGTHGGFPVQSNFNREIRNFVKVPPPKLSISLVGKDLHVRASPPDFKSSCWKYQFNFKKCNEDEKSITGNQQWEFSLEYNEACHYTVRVQAIYQYCGEGGSDWSAPVHYGENRDPVWPLKMTSIVTPIIVACCLIVALVLCRRHKDYLFPKIPEPSLLVKDMLNNSKDKGLNVGKLYIPYEDVVEKKISLEPESTFLHPEP